MKKPIAYPIMTTGGKIYAADGTRFKDCFSSVEEMHAFVIAAVNAAAPKLVSLERPPRPARMHPAIFAPYGCMDPHPVANIIADHIARCAAGG